MLRLWIAAKQFQVTVDSFEKTTGKNHKVFEFKDQKSLIRRVAINHGSHEIFLADFLMSTIWS